MRSHWVKPVQARSVLRALQEFQNIRGISESSGGVKAEVSFASSVGGGGAGDGERRRSLDAAEPAEVVTKAAEVEAAMAAEAADDEAKFEQLFRELDADNSGEIDEEELADWILRVRPQSPFKSAMPFQELLD